MTVKHKKSAFTIVELLTVLLIITLLIALLLPALALVRKMAKETQQRAQFTTIELALTAFKNDYGDYPPSSWPGDPPSNFDYGGTQMLTEALVGWDLLGFHPDSAWRADGEDGSGAGAMVYLDGTESEAEKEENLKKRRGPYLELATANVFKLEDLFDDTGPVAMLAPDTYVLCDVFAIRRISLASGDIIKAGTPLLYYRADTSSKTLDPSVMVNDRIYDSYDNFALIARGALTADGSPGKPHEQFNDLEDLYKYDYEGGIRDSKITDIHWPHRPDSYILISAGADGLYGTKDDIRNF